MDTHYASPSRFAHAPWIPVVAALCALMPVLSAAHAIVVGASPSAHARVAPGPIDIELRFNSRIDVDRSRLALRAPDGNERAVAIVRAREPGVIAGHGEVATTGPWSVRWQVLSVDGHVTRGEIPFRVDGP